MLGPIFRLLVMVLVVVSLAHIMVRMSPEEGPYVDKPKSVQKKDG